MLLVASANVTPLLHEFASREIQRRQGDLVIVFVLGDDIVKRVVPIELRETITRQFVELHRRDRPYDFH